MASKIFFIVGPTAIGKSDVAISLAQKINGEIVSCDSMQVYKEINIASNKPSDADLKKIPHHLVNILSIEEEFNVARFNRLACEAIDTIHSNGRVPIVVGGSGLYMQILLDGIFEGAPKDDQLRLHLQVLAEEKGAEHLHVLLKEKDAHAAENIHPNNVKRIIRALEVCMTKEAPISSVQKNREGLWGKHDVQIYGLNCERARLYEKINQRVEKMFEQGLVAEIKALESKTLSLTAASLIGIKEVQNYLKGESGEALAKEQMKLNTRHFAKRQLSWFRREERIRWINVQSDDAAESLSEGILNYDG